MVKHWEKVLAGTYGLDVSLNRLDGERDLNFSARSIDGNRYILKVMHVGCDPMLVDLQTEALRHIRTDCADIPLPEVVKSLQGKDHATAEDEAGIPRIIWLLQALEGLVYAEFNPKSCALTEGLGRLLGKMDKSLEGFTHPFLDRDFKWNLLDGGWIANELSVLDDTPRRHLIAGILAEYESVLPEIAALPKVAIHNDLNDYNILVRASPGSAPEVSGLIDLGDMTAGPGICDLAIAGAYIVLHEDDPEAALAALVSGYHSEHPLTPAEIGLIYPLLRMRLALSVVISALASVEKPDDPYVVISQEPAWKFLENNNINNSLLQARLRCACGMPVTDAAPAIHAFLRSERGKFAPVMGASLADAPMGALSVAASVTPQDPFSISSEEAAHIGKEYDEGGNIWLGYYSEPRLIYTSDAFRNGPWKASDRRTVHLAVDAFSNAGHKIRTPMAATVVAVNNRTAHLDYGGMAILSHVTPEGEAFYTLYGHLDPAATETLTAGQELQKGEVFCQLGTPDQNGGWSPHLHFQMALTIEGFGDDWPGAADPREMEFLRQIFPNPAPLLNLPDDKVAYNPIDTAGLQERRKVHFAGNLKLSYQKPVMFLRGWKQHLFDEWGQPYLDAYNNVPHVGHAHPRIQAVAADQLLRMNSNTRYLHPAQTEFADKILSKMPAHLSVCFFVNSGSEANELALRLARAHTGGKHMITPDHGYHGNTTGVIDISAYKFNKPGGGGQKNWVHLVDVPDDYRGRFRRDDPARAAKYAAQIDGAPQEIEARNGRLAGFISEVFPSVGGQIIPPPGYLALVYEKIRAAGGVCIADEVQTGLGRLGKFYFGFEQQGASPDIVVLGKPIGNGHPIGVLVTSPEIASSFSNGIEFFSTFGGSNLSCRIGKEVLDIVDEERLQENAEAMGERLLRGLRALQDDHEIIGDVRGLGLFIGVELVTDRVSRTPATKTAGFILNRMRDMRVLIGTEGQYDNILKIRPPLTIDADDVEMLLCTLETSLADAAGQNQST